MKKIMNLIIDVKLFSAVIFIGTLILFMLAKTFLGTYEVSFVTIISFFFMAVLIAIIHYLLDNLNSFKWILSYLLTCATIFSMNMVFDYFMLSGIDYLYFLLFISFCYFGAMFAFYIISKFEVDVMNLSLSKYKMDN